MRNLTIVMAFFAALFAFSAAARAEVLSSYSLIDHPDTQITNTIRNQSGFESFGVVFDILKASTIDSMMIAPGNVIKATQALFEVRGVTNGVPGDVRYTSTGGFNVDTSGPVAWLSYTVGDLILQPGRYFFGLTGKDEDIGWSIDATKNMGNFYAYVGGSYAGQVAAAAPYSVQGRVLQTPGPEAGTGIAALAMGGLLFFAQRRRKAVAVRG